jgi:fused signal recognition particle receptor
MFGFGKRPKVASDHPADLPLQAPAPEAGGGFFSRLLAGLSRTRSSFSEGLGSLLLGKKAIDQDLMDELETRLLTADVGIKATTAIIEELTARLKRKELADSDALYVALKDIMSAMLKPCEAPLQIPAGLGKPFVILMVGVNGVGKTTTIGKLARRFQQEGRSVMLAAGDTFRAAAVEQLQVWGERNQVPVVAQHTGADSASVIFDAYQSARAKHADVLIADTAGRLHNKSHLMQELEKVVRVLKKLDDEVPQEILLVLDATTGQNALSQARTFTEVVKVSGIVISKLDGTARGGMVFAIAKELGLPLRFIGIGEKAEDLRPFAAEAFVDALFASGTEE